VSTRRSLEQHLYTLAPAEVANESEARRPAAPDGVCCNGGRNPVRDDAQAGPGPPRRQAMLPIRRQHDDHGGTPCDPVRHQRSRPAQPVEEGVESCSMDVQYHGHAAQPCQHQQQGIEKERQAAAGVDMRHRASTSAELPPPVGHQAQAG
jgi:hypothetical protein